MLERSRWLTAAVFLLALCNAMPAEAQVTRQQRRTATDLMSRSRDAGQLFAAGKLDQSAVSIDKIQGELVDLLAANQSTAMQRLAKPIYDRVARAHDLLELEAIELDALPQWKALLEAKPGASDKTGVNFQDDIAPWLVSRCGNCHINQRRGDFSLETFAALAAGTQTSRVIVAGNAAASRLVQVIKSGDMPRGGGQIPSGQVEKLELWINQGAKFSGRPTQPLRDLVVAAGGEEGLAVGRPQGDETVSFAADVAPILLENCNGCHINGRRPSANLRMDTFTSLLRGGDAGEIVVPGKPENSLLVQKIKGESGQRMPAGGRPALSKKQIATISTWIREGARFDGSAPGANLADDADQAWARRASESDLHQRRRELSLVSWSKVAPNKKSELLDNPSFLVLGDVRKGKLTEVLEQFQAAEAPARAALRLDKDQPLIAGGMTVYVLNSRYQYSEFGQMIEQRELPQSWHAHWNSAGLEVYSAVLLDDQWNADNAAPAALMATVGGYLGQFREVPYWFAEGMARNAVAGAHRRWEPVASWKQSAAGAVASLRGSKQLLDGQLNEENAALVGMAITNFMQNRSNRRRFDKLLSELQSGVGFDAAMRASFGPTPQVLKKVLGK